MPSTGNMAPATQTSAEDRRRPPALVRAAERAPSPPAQDRFSKPLP